MANVRVKVSSSGLPPARFVSLFGQACQAGVREIAQEGDSLVGKHITPVYKRPIPTQAQVAAFRRGGSPKRGRGMASTLLAARRNSKPAWQRTGELRAGRVMLISQHRAVITIHGASRKGIRSWVNGYAARRETMWRGWKPKRPAMGVRRQNEFFREGAKELKPKVPALFVKGFDGVMR